MSTEPNKGTLREQFVEAQRRTEPYAPKQDDNRKDAKNRALSDEFKNAQTRTEVPPEPAKKNPPKDIAHENKSLGDGLKPPPGASAIQKRTQYAHLEQTREKHRPQETPPKKPLNTDIGHLPHMDGPKDNSGKKTLSEEFKEARAKQPKDPPRKDDPPKKSK